MSKGQESDAAAKAASQMPCHGIWVPPKLLPHCDPWLVAAGALLGAGFTEGTVYILDAMSLENESRKPFKYSRGSVTHISFSHDSQYMATAVSTLPHRWPGSQPPWAGWCGRVGSVFGGNEKSLRSGGIEARRAQPRAVCCTLYGMWCSASPWWEVPRALAHWSLPLPLCPLVLFIGEERDA